MRRRAATALVVAAVLAVATVAIADSVRPRAPDALDDAAAAQLRDLGVAGTLVYTDPQCEIHALSLPDLTPHRAPEAPDLGCEISVSPDGERAAPGAARWHPDSSTYAICRASRIDVVPTRESYDGCAPAWRPDGMLTFVRDGAIRQAFFERIIVQRRELARAALSHPNAPSEGTVTTLRVHDLSWSSRREVVALIEARYAFGLPEDNTVIAGFRDGRLAWQAPRFGVFRRLIVSRGGDVMPIPADRQQLSLRFRITPSGPADWSPDGRQLAAATRASVYILDSGAARSVRIPVTARDLAWR
jgi:hypothetical protein